MHCPIRLVQLTSIYNGARWVGASPLSRDFPPMASVATAPSPALAPEEFTGSVTQIFAVPPARPQVCMGRVPSVAAGMNWITLSVIVIFHLGALAALFFFTWQRLTVMLILSVLAINVGIGMCYHRLLTHRGYQTPKWLEYLPCPSAPRSRSKAVPYFGWPPIASIISTATARATPTLPAKAAGGHTSDGSSGARLCTRKPAVLARYVPDLERSRFYVWLSKYHWMPITVSGVLLFGLGWSLRAAGKAPSECCSGAAFCA